MHRHHTSDRQQAAIIRRAYSLSSFSPPASVRTMAFANSRSWFNTLFGFDERGTTADVQDQFTLEVPAPSHLHQTTSVGISVFFFVVGERRAKAVDGGAESGLKTQLPFDLLEICLAHVVCGVSCALFCLKRSASSLHISPYSPSLFLFHLLLPICAMQLVILRYART